MVCEVVSYRARSALRDVGKALGLGSAPLDRLAKLVGPYDDLSTVTPELLGQAGLDPASPVLRQLLELAREVVRFPRHLAIHVGGFVITRRPLCETVPLEPAAMPGRTILQWDKDDIAELGLLKVDLLGLGMLSALSRCMSSSPPTTRRRPPCPRPTGGPNPAGLCPTPRASGPGRRAWRRSPPRTPPSTP